MEGSAALDDESNTTAAAAFPGVVVSPLALPLHKATLGNSADRRSWRPLASSSTEGQRACAEGRFG